MLADPKGLIRDLVQVANLSGFAISAKDVTHEVLRAPHRPRSLPKGKQAVYVFSLDAPGALVLKVGKAGPKSQARFQSHHYQPGRASSTLAASLLKKPKWWNQLDIVALDEDTVGDWLKTHTARDHFYLDARESKLLLKLLEAFLQARLRPLFEG